MSVITLYAWAGFGAAEAKRAETVRPPAPITAVTVYPDRALVTRTTRVDLAAGATEIVIEGLPGATVDASVRATGRGAAPVKLTGVDVSREHLTRPDDPRVRALEAEIRALGDADRSLQDEIQAVQALKAYLQTVQSRAMEPPREVQTHRIDVDGIRGIYGFLAENFSGAAKRQRDAEAARRDLQERLQKLQRDLQELRAPAAALRKTVAVGVEAARPGRFELEVSYSVPAAAWAPAYEARALAETREVELTYGARVTQRTGEAWEGVALALSTARPALGARAPSLNPWLVRLLAPPRSAAKSAEADRPAVAGAARAQLAPAAPPAAEPADAVDEGKDARLEQAMLATADVVAGGPSVVFKIARPAHIPNDSRQHKTTVAVERLPAEFSYLAVPKRSPFAYLVARTKPRGELPLLAGPVEVFREGDYIGRSRLDGAAPGEAFDLHLGVDEGIKVRREELARERGEAGFFGKTQRTRFAYEITVENFKRTAETITVQDQIPVAQDQEVEVAGLRLSQEPTERTEQGILKWTFKLAPQEKKVIRIEFAVSSPIDKPIAGL
jgi:uncharacterized protein (TIGR02231 family)